MTNDDPAGSRSKNHPPREEQERGAVGHAREVCPDEEPAARVRSHIDFGVVVGVEHYPAFQSLRGAAKDATAFYEWLCERDGGGLDRQRVELVLSNPTHGTPVQDEIDNKLHNVLAAAHALNGARRLYFYFSGHGATNRESGDDVALLLTRWSRSLGKLALSTEGYSSTLSGARLFDELAVFVDCCRSSSTIAVGVYPTLTLNLLESRSPTRRFIAYATESGQPAFETPSDTTWHGIFTRRLLDILRRSPCGVPAAALKDLLEREVKIEARKHGMIQSAHAENGFSEYSCFGYGGVSPVLELRFTTRRGSVVLIDGKLQRVAEHQACTTPWRLTLPVGLYRLTGGGAAPINIEHDGREAHDV